MSIAATLRMGLALRAALAGALAGLLACAPSVHRHVVRVGGSDTMVNLVQAWAEAYVTVRPDVSIQVGGGGSGVGVAQWLDATLDVAAISRDLQPGERAAARARWTSGWRTDTVAFDAIAVYVAPANPLEDITLDTLAEIYGEGGRLRRWNDLGIGNRACRGGEIIRVGRQNSSGTYLLFRTMTLGTTREYALGSIDQSGSRDVVSLVERTPCAIGYSGLAYQTPAVKILRVAARGRPAVAPSAATVLDGTYPMARALSLCSGRDAPEPVASFVQWVLAGAGQRIAGELGFVPVPPGAVAP